MDIEELKKASQDIDEDILRKAVNGNSAYKEEYERLSSYSYESFTEEVPAPPENETAVGQLKLLNDRVKSLEQLVAEKNAIIAQFEQAAIDNNEKARKEKVKNQRFSLILAIFNIVIGFALNHIWVKFFL